MRARPALAVVFLALLPLGGGCVVSYGGASGLRPEPLPVPNDLAEIEIRLESLIVGEIETDRRDRLVAAIDLSRQAALMAPTERQQVQRYLQRVVAIEERNQPMSAPSLFEEALPELMATFSPVGVQVDEEDLGGVQDLNPPAEEPAVPPGESENASESESETDNESESESESRRVLERGSSSSDPVALARAALEAGDPGAALAALEPCAQVACADGVSELRARVEEAWIHQERERAGAIYLRARSEPDPTERALRLAEARAILEELLIRFPSAPQAEAIRRNLDLVRKEPPASP